MLDASAILTLIHHEPGAGTVADRISGSTMSTANLAEVIGKIVDIGVDPRPLPDLLRAAGVTIEPLTSDDAQMAGVLRSVPGSRQLSLGDRCCLALALRRPGSEVLTADHAWSELDLPLTITQIR